MGLVTKVIMAVFVIKISDGWHKILARTLHTCADVHTHNHSYTTSNYTLSLDKTIRNQGHLPLTFLMISSHNTTTVFNITTSISFIQIIKQSFYFPYGISGKQPIITLHSTIKHIQRPTDQAHLSHDVTFPSQTCLNCCKENIEDGGSLLHKPVAKHHTQQLKYFQQIEHYCTILEYKVDENTLCHSMGLVEHYG